MKCPICGGEQLESGNGYVTFLCNTTSRGGQVDQGIDCIVIEHARLKKRVKALEEAGDLVLKLDSNLEWAEAERVWEEAKASK